jgi:sarcosine oxidase, subunit beta
MASSDILVVGGGVIGTSIALHLARRRAGRVVLLEKAFPGAGASGKSAAIVRTRHATPLTSAMAQHGLHVYDHFGETIGGPPVFTRTGLALIAPNSSRADLESAATSGNDEFRLIGAHELAEIDSNVHLGEDEVAAIEPMAGYVDAVQVLASLTDAARRHGVDVRLSVEVKGITLEKGRVTGVETNEGSQECRALVLATGAWTAGLARPLKIGIPIDGIRSPAALFRRPPDAGRRGLVLVDFVQNLYFRPTQGEMIHIGGTVPDDSQTGANPEDFDESAPGDWLRSVRQRLTRRYPALHRAVGRGGFSAVLPGTEDGHPIVDRLPGMEGAWCATGFGANGFDLAPAVGESLAEWVVDGKPSTFDLVPLRLARFQEDDLVKPAWPFGLLT